MPYRPYDAEDPEEDEEDVDDTVDFPRSADAAGADLFFRGTSPSKMRCSSRSKSAIPWSLRLMMESPRKAAHRRPQLQHYSVLIS